MKQDLQYIPINDPSKVFTTYDLGLAAAMLAVGFELLSIDKFNTNKVLFVFEQDSYIKDIAKRYFADQLEVRARSFFDHLKALKSMLYSK